MLSSIIGDFAGMPEVMKRLVQRLVGAVHHVDQHHAGRRSTFRQHRHGKRGL